jgi:hypothetical protein
LCREASRQSSVTHVALVTDPAKAAHRPELTVLSAAAHGETEQGVAIADITGDVRTSSWGFDFGNVAPRGYSTYPRTVVSLSQGSVDGERLTEHIAHSRSLCGFD